jgi:hypothetical protein
VNRRRFEVRMSTKERRKTEAETKKKKKKTDYQMRIEPR